jgi:hypothetical protein
MLERSGEFVEGDVRLVFVKILRESAEVRMFFVVWSPRM